MKCAKNQNAGAGRVKRVESAEPCSNFCLCSLNMHISDVLVAITVVTAQNRPWGVLETTTATANTTPQLNDLIGWMGKNNRSERATPLLVQLFYAFSQITTRDFHI